MEVVRIAPSVPRAPAPVVKRDVIGVVFPGWPVAFNRKLKRLSASFTPKREPDAARTVVAITVRNHNGVPINLCRRSQ